MLPVYTYIVIVSGQKCPLYWQQRGSICYRYSYTNLKSWTDAETWCQAQNAHLVKFENVNERVGIVLILSWIYEPPPPQKK